MVRSSSHTFANTRGHLIQPVIYGELLFDLPCTARTYRYSVLSSSQSLLLYTTTCMEPPVEGSIQHGNVRYVHPCVHERLLTVYQLLLSYLLPKLLECRERQRQTISQHHSWEAGYRIPGRFSLTLTMGDNNSSLTTGAALVVVMVVMVAVVAVQGRTISTT